MLIFQCTLFNFLDANFCFFPIFCVESVLQNSANKFQKIISKKLFFNTIQWSPPLRIKSSNFKHTCNNLCYIHCITTYYPECTIPSRHFAKKLLIFCIFWSAYKNRPHTNYENFKNDKWRFLYMCWWDLRNILKSLTMLLALLSIAKLQALCEKARKKRKLQGMFKEPPFDAIENVSWEISQMLWPTYVVYSCQAAILRSVSSMNQSLVKTDKNYVGNCYFARPSYIPAKANRFSSCSLFGSVHT